MDFEKRHFVYKDTTGIVYQCKTTGKMYISFHIAVQLLGTSNLVLNRIIRHLDNLDIITHEQNSEITHKGSIISLTSFYKVALRALDIKADMRNRTSRIGLTQVKSFLHDFNNEETFIKFVEDNFYTDSFRVMTPFVSKPSNSNSNINTGTKDKTYNLNNNWLSGELRNNEQHSLGKAILGITQATNYLNNQYSNYLKDTQNIKVGLSTIIEELQRIHNYF